MVLPTLPVPPKTATTTMMRVFDRDVDLISSGMCVSSGVEYFERKISLIA